MWTFCLPYICHSVSNSAVNITGSNRLSSHFPLNSNSFILLLQRQGDAQWLFVRGRWQLLWDRSTSRVYGRWSMLWSSSCWVGWFPRQRGWLRVWVTGRWLPPLVWLIPPTADSTMILAGCLLTDFNTLRLFIYQHCIIPKRSNFGYIKKRMKGVY